MSIGCDSSVGLVHEPTHSQKTRRCGALAPEPCPPNSHILKYFTSNSNSLKGLAGTIPKSLTLKDRGQGGFNLGSNNQKILSRGLNRHFRPNLLNLPKIYFLTRLSGYCA
jgi:hypothetical protein